MKMTRFLLAELNTSVNIMEVLLGVVVPEMMLNVVSRTAEESAL